jgi:spoIIIJ-associated protein
VSNGPEDMSAGVVDFIGRVTAAMGLALDAIVEETRDGLRVNLKGDDGEVLLRRKGEALQALQHLTNTVFRHDGPQERRIVVDCQDFRKARESELRQMALLLAERAKRTGLEQPIGPLNPFERRIVHLAVADDPLVTSESIGDAFIKTVIIAARRGQVRKD